MIENETQYHITCHQLARLQEGLVQAEQSESPESVHPILWAAQFAGIRSWIESLEAEIAEWERKNVWGFGGDND